MDKKISQLDLVTTLDQDDVLPIVNAGVTKKVKVSQLLEEVETGVPYTGATQDVDLGEFGLKAGQVTLDTTPTGTPEVGTTIWNDTSGVPETTLKGGLFSIKNGIDLVARVVNKVTPNTTLLKSEYKVVKISGSQGQRLAVDLAQANNDNNSADTLGFVAEDIATNQEGFIMTVGQLEGLNTTGSLQSETWQDGDVLYLSPTVAGAITNVKPNGSTGHIVVVGYVEYAHANNGKIYVKIMNGWELDELHNVLIDTPLNDQALVYEQSTQLWKNKTLITSEVLKTTPTVTFVGTVAPSGVENKSYNYQIVGKRVTFDFSAVYTVAGTISQVVIELPSELPSPVVPTGFSGADVTLYIGSAFMGNTITSLTISSSDVFSGIRRNSSDTAYEFFIQGLANSYRAFRMTISYPIQ